jgi:hypothetical protein
MNQMIAIKEYTIPIKEYTMAAQGIPIKHKRTRYMIQLISLECSMIIRVYINIKSTLIGSTLYSIIDSRYDSLPDTIKGQIKSIPV